MKDFERENISRSWVKTISPSKNEKEQFIISPPKNGKEQFTIHHRKTEKSNSLFHHRIMKKSNSPFHHRKTEKIILPFHHCKMEKSILPFDQQNLHRKKKKSKYQINRTQDHNIQSCHRRKRNAIRRKSVGNTGNMTRENHHRATVLICLTTVITDASDVRGRATGKSIWSNYAHV